MDGQTGECKQGFMGGISTPNSGEKIRTYLTGLRGLTVEHVERLSL